MCVGMYVCMYVYAFEGIKPQDIEDVRLSMCVCMCVCMYMRLRVLNLRM